VLVSFIVALVLGNPPPEFAHWRICYAAQGGIWTSDGLGNHRKRIVAKGESPCWSPDHTRIAFIRKNGVWVTTADGTMTARVLKTPIDSESSVLAWGKGISPSRTWEDVKDIWGDESILIAKEKNLLEIPISHGRFGKPRPTFTERSGYDGETAAPAISTDGKSAAISLNGDVWLARMVPAEGGGSGGWDLWRIAALATYDQATYRADAEIHYVQSLDFSPDGKTLAFELSRIGGSGYNVVGLIRNVPRLKLGDESPLTLRDMTILSETAFHPRFSPDGKWLLVHDVSTVGASNPNGGLTALSLDGRQRIRLVPGAVTGDW
jgi:WD40-like Beta Propeller Repeat